MRILIIGYGTVGRNMDKVFPAADVHDPAHEMFARAGVGYDVGFVCVPTEMLLDRSADTSIVERCVGEHESRCRVLCIKSTVPPGTTEALTARGFRCVMSPEYFGATQHANAVDYGFVILGGQRRDTAVVAEAYKQVKPAQFRILQTDATTAELVKYGENAWIAAKVTFVNEFARICSAFGVDFNEWRELWLADPRINPSHTFAYPDRPYYDSHCLTKDVPAIIRAAQAAGYTPRFLEAMERYNAEAKERAGVVA